MAVFRNRNSAQVNKYGRPLKGRGRRSGALDYGTLDKPMMINLTKHRACDLTARSLTCNNNNMVYQDLDTELFNSADYSADYDNLLSSSSLANADIKEVKEVREFTVIDLNGKLRDELLYIQNSFDSLPDLNSIRSKASRIKDLAVLSGAKYAWVGGPGYLMRHLEIELLKSGIKPCYSWSRRMYMNIPDKSGVIHREMYRQHMGWIVIDS